MRARHTIGATLVFLLALGVAACGGADSAAPEPTRSTPALTPRPVPSADDLPTTRLTVDPDFWAVNDAGDVLNAAIDTDGAGSSEWCATDRAAAFIWNGHDGSHRTWTGDVTAREIAAAKGGFVVGSVLPDCSRSQTGPHGDPDGYMVTGTGTTIVIRWPAGEAGVRAREICTPHPRDRRCVFDAIDGTGRLLSATVRPPTGRGHYDRLGDLLVVRKNDPRGLWWSKDGITWEHHRGPLQHPIAYEWYLTGDILLLGDDDTIDYSLDGGATWTVRHLGRAAEQVGITTSGTLFLVPTRGKATDFSEGRVLFSTDATWSHLMEMDARATTGPLWLRVVGDVAYVFTLDATSASSPLKWWVTTDQGAHWRIVEPRAD